MKLKPCTPDDIAGLMPLAKKEGLYFSSSTQLYSAWVDSVLVGFCGIVWYKRHCKFKSDFVLPVYRRKGYYSEMMKIKFDMAKNMDYITATCTKSSLPIWLKLGAKITKQYSDVTTVRLQP